MMEVPLWALYVIKGQPCQMDKLACFYIWHVKQLQILQGDLVKKNLVPFGKR